MGVASAPTRRDGARWGGRRGGGGRAANSTQVGGVYVVMVFFLIGFNDFCVFLGSCLFLFGGFLFEEFFEGELFVVWSVGGW